MAVFGIAIPIIIRNGPSTTTVHLSDLSLKFTENDVPVLDMKISRAGNMSVYGDIKVNYISPKGATTQVGLVNGLSVYTPNKLRRFKIKLEAKGAINYHAGKLQVEYVAQTDGKPLKFAEAELFLN